MKDERVFIIAEISANHGQNFERAVKMVVKAKECGADAVKFQAYTPDTITINCKKPYFKITHPQWGGQTLYDLYKKAYTPWHWFPKLKKIAEDIGIIFFATAFDKTSVDMLEDLKVPIHKISSFELIDIPLIKYVGKTRKPLILSTGMASENEINEACKAARRSGCRDITLLRCISSYPAPPEAMNLRTMIDMKKRFRCSVGVSDHTMGTEIALLAVGMGATLIEKHFKLSNQLKTEDSFFSITPKELSHLVRNIRLAEKTIGSVCYGSSKYEKSSKMFRRSLFVVKDIKKGDRFSLNTIRSIRPNSGLPPKFLDKVLKSRATSDLKAGTPLQQNMIKPSRT